MIDLLKRVQNRQYDDQRGTSLTAFKEMPDFLRESTDDDVEQLITNKEFTEKCAVDESRIEMCRRRDSNINCDVSLSPAQCFQQNATFSDEDDIPSHENAEQYFSCNGYVTSSPDYSDPKLMEKSVRDIGMESPVSGSRGWTLIGSIADNPCTSPVKPANDTFVFAVPTGPPLRLYRRRVSTPLPVTAVDRNVPAHGGSSECLAQSANLADIPLSVDTSVGQNELSSSATPSPSTHDLVLTGSDCVVTTSNHVCSVQQQHALAPIVDPEDSGEEFGIV